MLESLCHALAKNINQNELDEEEEILIFGIHYLINYLIVFIIAILFGLLTTSLFETFLFLLIVLPIRTVQGGIHFKSSLLCFIVSISLCIVPYFLMHIDFNHLSLFPLALFSILLLFIMDVLENRNNPMTDKELHFLNKKARKIELLYLGVMLLLQLLHMNYISFFVNSAIVVSMISFYLGLIAKKLSK